VSNSTTIALDMAKPDFDIVVFGRPRHVGER
jgi:hypothetical protein